jgi:RNA polymerase sigma-70 factor (ECF subfamily)
VTKPSNHIPIVERNRNLDKEQAFTTLIQKHQGLLFKVTTLYTDTKEDQQDLFQEVVYQLWKYFDTFRNESKITTWMYRVAMNTAITHLKKNKRKPNAISVEEVIIATKEGADTEYEDRVRKLYNYLNRLNPLEKGVMLLLLDGKSYKDISEITGLRPSNVGTRISRIKTKLKDNLIK